MKIKFSIIIPVYNVESFLHECIESVLHQDFKHFEIILINDGSTDGSLLICEQYLEKYPEVVRLIDQQNMGISVSRNNGINIAEGEYIILLDSDDMLDERCLAMIDNVTQKQVDVAICNGYLCLYPDSNKEIFIHELNDEKINKGNAEDVLLHYLNSNYPSWSAWEHVYRADYLRNNKLYFREGKLCEDAEWTYKVILGGDTFSLIPKPFYVYRKGREGSIMNTYSFNRWKDLTQFCDEWIERSTKLNNKLLKSKINYVYISMGYGTIRDIHYFKSHEKDIANKYVRNSKYLQNPITITHKFYSGFIRFFGVSSLSFWIYVVEKIRFRIKKILTLRT